MDGVAILLAVIKVAIIIGFLMNVGGILTWTERRQMAMIHDRVGPNRAVIYVPSAIVKGIFAGGGFALTGAVAAYFYYRALTGPEPIRLGASFALLQIGILCTWLVYLFMQQQVRSRGPASGFDDAIVSIADPRHFFYGGLVAHALVLLVSLAVSLPDAKPIALPVAVLGFLLAAAALAGGGLWAAAQMGTEKFGLRLAGLLHPLADGAKFIFKEDFIPPGGDRLLHSLGPMIAVFPAFVTFAVIPFGDTLCARWGAPDSFLSAIKGFQIAATVPRSGVCAEGGVQLQLIDLNVGILYMFALAGTGIIGAAIAGWSSDNKYSLLGGLRAASQMVSYEVGMGLSLVGAMMLYGSVRLDDMVRWQSEHAWGIFLMPAAFFLFLTTSIAENKRTPFDAPEGESEIVAGYFLEYSGMKFSMFMLGEYIEIAVSSAVLVTIFFGGYALPFLHRDGITVAFGGSTLYHLTMTHGSVILIGALAFFGKTIVSCFLLIFIRWTVPRFRYDQIMKLGWRILLPASLVNMLLTGVVILAVDRGGPALSNALGVAADITQAVVVLGGASLVVWFVALLVKPVHRTQKIVSSSAKFVAAAGGVKSTPMQA